MSDSRDAREKKDSRGSPPTRHKRLRWLRREGIDLGDAAVQFLAVLIGVLLAMFISNWNTQRHQQATADTAMNAIRAELVANRAALHKNAEGWYKVARSMIAAAGSDSPKRQLCFQRPGWGGYGEALLTDAAYRTAISTNALAHMPFEQAHRVAEIYGFQQRYHKAFRLLREHILFAGPKPLGICIAGVVGLGRHDKLLSSRYTALIGADNSNWATPPPVPQTAKRASNGGAP